MVGAPEVRSWGGRVVIVPTVEGFSTTNIVAGWLNPPIPRSTNPRSANH